MSKQIQSIAIIDPIGDFGIGGYVYELAEGLSANGVKVDVYTSGRAHMKDLMLPRKHTLYPVLGSPLVRQRDRLRRTPHLPTNTALLSAPSGREVVRERRGLVPKVASLLMPYELALYLKMRRYDVIWTQWPVMPRYGIQFWAVCRVLGMRMVHTVHDVMPHEETSKELAVFREICDFSDALIVHSEYSKEELLRLFPKCGGKVLMSRIGLYTMFSRSPENANRLREKLDIPKGHGILLSYGSVRPYKNIEGALQALRETRIQNTVLVVAGREFGYPELVHGDPLGRTRRLAASLGVPDRVRFMPGMLDFKTTAELFEIADALLLPYLQSYGSAVLLLGMTFGLHVIATRTGGMEEYLEGYPAHTLLAGTDAASVADGIKHAMKSVIARGRSQDCALPHLDWRNIAKEVLQNLQEDPTTS